MELQELIKKLEGSVNPEILEGIAEKYPQISKEDQNAVIQTLQYWAAKVELVKKYGEDRSAVIKKGIEEVKVIEDKMQADYREAMENLEKEEDLSSTKEAETLIKQI